MFLVGGKQFDFEKGVVMKYIHVIMLDGQFSCVRNKNPLIQKNSRVKISGSSIQWANVNKVEKNGAYKFYHLKTIKSRFVGMG